MNRFAIKTRHSDLDEVSNFRAISDSQYRLPMLPKISVILNINSAILAMILTVVFTIIDQHRLVDSIVYLSHLIFCFTF